MIEVATKSGATVMLGSLAKQEPDQVDIRGGKIKGLQVLEAFNASIDELKVKRLSILETLAVVGAVTLGSTLSVAGEATFEDAVTMAELTVTGDVAVGGDLTVTGGLAVGGDASADSLTLNGNLTFLGASRRIIGDFSNGTIASRVIFQTSTTNDSTLLGVLPNGTATTSRYTAWNAADPANSSEASFGITGTQLQIISGIRGGGSYKPIVFQTGGVSDRLHIDTSGNVGFGRAPTFQLDNYRSGAANTTIATANDTVTGIFQVSGTAQANLGTTTNHPLVMLANNIARMTLTAGGFVQVHGLAGTGATLEFNNAIQNLILWGTAGVVAPSFTTRSAGTKLVLYPAVGGAAVDYAIGIESGAMWLSVPTTNQVFRWYGGTTLLAELLGTAVLLMYNGTVASGTADAVKFYSAGHTIPSFYCEGTDVLQTGMADSASSRRVRMRINGTVVELLGI
jgi:hypothetical protein